VRFNIQSQMVQQAQLSFATTIFTCIVLTVASLTFSNDTEEIVIVPIQKQIGIIKTLADDPLKRPEPPQIPEDDDDSPDNHMRTLELEKTLFRIGNLLQMAYGRLGAIIIKENVSSGDGGLEIMIPGRRINVIFMVIKINDFVDITEIMREQIIILLNKIIKVIHVTAEKWSGSPNKNDGDRLLITWKLPDIEEGESEKNEQLLEQRTEYADKALITAVKIVSEIRRVSELASFSKKPDIVKRFGNNYRPNLTFGLHMGWTIEGAIGSESKIDACYLSPQRTIAERIEDLTHYYDMQILVTESLYNLMSLKARNTLRKIDVITMAESKEPRGIYTFDLSFNNQETNLPDDHEVGDLIKL
jgi:class 3 adenylate cyclase